MLSCYRSGIDIYVLDFIFGIAIFLDCSSGNVITSYNNSGITSSVLDFIFGIAIIVSCNSENEMLSRNSSDKVIVLADSWQTLPVLITVIFDTASFITRTVI
jgi:hypothetical protein